MHRAAAALALAALLAAAGAAADPTPHASLDEPVREFSIAAQPLSQALRAYAEQSGDQVVFYSDLGEGRESRPVEGRFTREQALEKLLEDTGLEHRRVNSKTIAITRASREESPQTDTSYRRARRERLRLAQAAPSPGRITQDRPISAPEQSLFGVEEVIVTGTAVPGRTKFDSSAAISTFNALDIAQQSPESSADLIAAVPGFWVESTSGSTQANVFARGIIQDGGYRYVALMEDGLPLYPVSELAFYNPDQFVRIDSTIERVEALRGGAAPIFTPGAIGGAVNLVTRTAGDAPSALLRFGVSDYALYRTDLAWSSPIGDDWGVALGGYYRRSDGVRDPGYAADAGGQFRITLSRTFHGGAFDVFAKYIDDRSLFVVPVPLTGPASDPTGIDGADPGTYSLHSEDLARAPLPPSAAQVGLQDSKLENGIHPQLATIGARFERNFGGNATLENLARFTSGEVDFDAIFSGEAPQTGLQFAADHGVAPDYVVAAGGEPYDPADFVQSHGRWVVNKQYEALQDDLRITFRLAEHALTFGAYGADYSMADRWSLGNVLLMDVRDRPRRLLLPGVTDPDGYTRYSFLNLIADYDATAYSFYFADEWQVTRSLRVDLGARYDSQQIEGAISTPVLADLDGDPRTLYDNETALASESRRRVHESFAASGFSLGFNYAFTGAHAIFGRYTDAAKLPHFDDVRNGVLREDNVSNIEIGYKTSQERFVVFATLFQTEFDNVPFQDILANGETVVRRAATYTRGLELEGELYPFERLSVRFSLTHQDPEYRDFIGSTVDNTGASIRRIPKTFARITPTLSFMHDRARVFFTYSYVGERFANDENTIRLPSYQKLDAGVMFDVGENWTLRLSGDNLNDAVGLTEGNPRTDVGAGGVGTIYTARPLFGRSVMGSATFRY